MRLAVVTPLLSACGSDGRLVTETNPGDGFGDDDTVYAGELALRGMGAA